MSHRNENKVHSAIFTVVGTSIKNVMVVGRRISIEMGLFTAPTVPKILKEFRTSHEGPIENESVLTQQNSRRDCHSRFNSLSEILSL